jgi:hypothetical protein
MIGERLVEVVAHIPAHAQPVGSHPHELAFGADPFQEHHQLEPKEDDGINGRAAIAFCVAAAHELTHEGEIDRAVQVAVEVVGRHQVLQGQRRDRRNSTVFPAHHGVAPFGCWRCWPEAVQAAL